MARRIFLHIGLPKTGTTFLQTMMWHHRAQLREQGFLYPGTKRMDHYRAWQDIKRHRSDLSTGAWDRLRAEIEAWDGDALLSHEFFSTANHRQVARTVAGLPSADLRLLVTARAYPLQLPAVWQEALKMGSTHSFDEFLEAMLPEDGSVGHSDRAWSWRSQDLVRVLRRWTNAVPSSHVTVITVPPPGSPRTLLWDRWCEAVEIDDADFDLDTPTANESLGAGQAALLRRVAPHASGPLEHGHERHRWLRQYLGHEVLGPQRGARFGPRPHHAERLRQRSSRAVEVIQSRGYRVIGDHRDLLAGPVPEAAHPDDVPHEEVLEVAGVTIEQMVRDVRELTQERDELRAQLQGGRRTASLRARLLRVARAGAGRIRARRRGGHA